MWYTRWALRRIRQREGRSAVVYFHPWEIDPGQPRLSGGVKARLRHYFNLTRMEGRIRELLADAPFVPLRSLLENQLALGPLPSERIAKVSQSD
jgi:hypothetical protein